MPGDLNLKKSWNPALVKNQKKVWEREQDALKEYQAIKQRRKEIEHEREKEELIRLQYGNDPENLPAKQKLELNKLGWMYTDAPDVKEPEVNEAGFREVEEDFLSNKDDVEQLLKGGRAVKKSQESRFDKVATVGAKRAATTLSDDPLLMIKREKLRTHTSARTPSRDREKSPSRRSRDDSDRHRHHSRHSHSSSRSSHRHSSENRHSSRPKSNSGHSGHSSHSNHSSHSSHSNHSGHSSHSSHSNHSKSHEHKSRHESTSKSESRQEV